MAREPSIKTPPPVGFIAGTPTTPQLRALARKRSRVLLWQAEQLSKRGEHDLAATFADAAKLVEKGLAADARRKLKEARRMASESGTTIPRPRRNEEDEEPRL